MPLNGITGAKPVDFNLGKGGDMAKREYLTLQRLLIMFIVKKKIDMKSKKVLPSLFKGRGSTTLNVDAKKIIKMNRLAI